MEVDKFFFCMTVLNSFVVFTACANEMNTRNYQFFCHLTRLKGLEIYPVHVDPWTGPVFCRNKLLA
jgi:hypothetical protein